MTSWRGDAVARLRNSTQAFLKDPLVALIDQAPLKVWRRMAARAVITRASSIWPERPDRLPAAMMALQWWGGVSLPGAVAASAARYPKRISVIDDDGAITYTELARRSTALAAALMDAGIAPQSKVGLLARNHIGFVVAAVAVAKTGADLVLLNTGFAAAQLAEVASAEGLDAIIHDDEFEPIARESGLDLVLDERSVGRRLAAFADARIRPPTRASAFVVLTSGTTGRPKGAARSGEGADTGVAAVLARIPLRPRTTVVVAAPLFHAWGLSHMTLGLGLCSTLVLRRRFDPETTLRDVEQHRAGVLVVVPVMLQRLLALGPDVLVDVDTSTLRVIASSGSALGGKLALDTLDRFGPVLYNVYGSTEVATGTIATPHDLLKAPTTAGMVAPGSRVEILDDDGRPVRTGITGHIFVGNPMSFHGYTTGGSKEMRRGLLSSGDVGHFDRRGLLYIDGRDDDMIISGGENVFPGEVEELLSHHPAIVEVAVIGVEDEDFGQALKAFVVARAGTSLARDDVRQYVGDNLARYKVPRHVEFLDELPRSPTGKILKRTLR